MGRKDFLLRFLVCSIVGNLFLFISILSLATPPPVPLLDESIPLIQADKVHKIGITGKGVKILVIDNFTKDGPWIPQLGENLSHGYMVSKIIQVVAPDAEIIECWGIGEDKEHTPEECLELYGGRVNIVNMSFGGDLYEKLCPDEGEMSRDGDVGDEITYFTNQGVIFVKSAGNNGKANALTYPGCHPRVISVGAVYDSLMLSPLISRPEVCPKGEIGRKDKITCYSNSAFFLDVLAPGERITLPGLPDIVDAILYWLQMKPNWFGGTSWAAPHVTGVVALILEAKPCLKPSQIETILKKTGKKVQDRRNKRTFSRVDAFAAVKEAQKSNCFPIANAGPDQTVQVGSTVQLDGSGSSDPDGDTLKYSWKFIKKPSGSKARLSNSRIPNPAFIADKEGEYVLELKVQDSKRAISSDQVKITARTDITPPALITNFQASDNEDSQSTLTWTNPSDSDLAQVIVKRKTDSYPANHDDGETRLTIDSAIPGKAETFVDAALINGTTYYYAVFSRDKAGNWNDQVIEGKNADTGRPQGPSIPTGLIAGVSNPGKVYRYQGGSDWQAISGELDFAVLSLIEYNGVLYAGTMSADGVGRLYRYDGGTTWTIVCDNLDNQVSSLAVYKGNLYIGTSMNGGRLYRFDGPGNCILVVDHRDPGDWRGFRSAYVWGDYLYLGDFGYDIIGRFDGTTFEHIIHLGGSCIYDFALYNGELYAGAYQGTLYKSPNGTNWSQVLPGEGSHLWEIEVFKGWLFMGFNSRILQRFDGTNRETVWTASDSIISMVAQGDNQLYIGTGGEAGYQFRTDGDGKVYTYDGNTVTLISDSLGTGVQVLYLASGSSGTSAPTIKTSDTQILDVMALPRAPDLIEFRVKEGSNNKMQINIFSLSGRSVFRTDWVSNGFIWHGQDIQGRPLANGVYLYVITVRGWDGTILRSEVKKLVVLR